MGQETDIKQLSYSLGVVIANNLKGQVKVEDLDVAQLAKGVEDMLGNADSELALPEAAQVVQSYFQKIAEEQTVESRAAQEKFFAENAKKEGIVALPSGLQYEILRKGEGAIPKASDTVVAHYEGRLLDGSIFDSSIRRGEPATFPVNALIMGWQEALQLMPTGSRWRLYIPYQLGYGEQGAGADIPPCASLVFDLELIKIV